MSSETVSQEQETVSQEQLLTESQTAELLTIKPQTLSVWRSTGKNELPFVKVGRAVRYRRSDIMEWLEHRTATCATR